MTKHEPDTPGRPGRPRGTAQRRPGETVREEILDAAAELFTTRGYAGTSTRQIAEAVGIRQASLYHHFPSKSEIMNVLLETTVEAPLALARDLVEADGDPLERLLQLARFDVTQLLEARFNLGALYHLPELAGDEFAEFRRDRGDLAAAYKQLANDVMHSEPNIRAELPFRLVESVIGIRSDRAVPADNSDRAGVVDSVAAAIVDLLARDFNLKRC